MSTLSKILNCIQEKVNFTDEEAGTMLENLQGTDMSDYEVVDKKEVGAEPPDIDSWINEIQLAVIKQDANAESRLDKNEFKVRYEYTEKIASTNSRDFCKQMMRRTNSGVVYRYEDIVQASFSGVNSNHGHKGRPYSLFKYKGGVNCHHVWTANLYRLKTKKGSDVPVKDKGLGSSEEIPAHSTHYSPKPAGLKESEIPPTKMPRHGHHPNWGK